MKLTPFLIIHSYPPHMNSALNPDIPFPYRDDSAQNAVDEVRNRKTETGFSMILSNPGTAFKGETEPGFIFVVQVIKTPRRGENAANLDR